MRPGLLRILCCPSCRGDLDVEARQAADEAGRIRDGRLRCAGCQSAYPILNWVPRLLAAEQLTAEERAALDSPEGDHAAGPQTPRIVSMPPPEEAAREIERMVRAKIFYAELPPKLHARAERNLEYLLRHSEEKRKFVLTVLPYVKDDVRVVADLGGGQGGTLKAFREEFRPEISLLVDIDPEWVEVAVLREPENEVVRGDGMRMPVKDGALDLLVTTAALEHIPDWRAAVREMYRTARRTLLCYGPNGAFPYDFGHLDAPFVTWLPPRPGWYVAKAFHWVRRTGRTMESIRGERAVTYYIPRRTVVRELRSAGVSPRNVFDEFLGHSVREAYHLQAPGLKSILARHGWLRRLFSGFFVTLGMEPNVYLFFEGKRPAASRLRQAEKQTVR